MSTETKTNAIEAEAIFPDVASTLLTSLKAPSPKIEALFIGMPTRMLAINPPHDVTCSFEQEVRSRKPVDEIPQKAQELETGLIVTVTEGHHNFLEPSAAAGRSRSFDAAALGRTRAGRSTPDLDQGTDRHSRPSCCMPIAASARQRPWEDAGPLDQVETSG